MSSKHKNKTYATLLTAVFGGFGTYRFYLYGRKNIGGWAHFLSLPISFFIHFYFKNSQLFFASSPFLLSILIGFLEALIIGLTPDNTWDEAHNTESGIQSQSQWPLALILILIVAIGAVLLIASIARLFDLLFTGGAYG